MGKNESPKNPAYVKKDGSDRGHFRAKKYLSAYDLNNALDDVYKAIEAAKKNV